MYGVFFFLTAAPSKFRNSNFLEILTKMHLHWLKFAMVDEPPSVTNTMVGVQKVQLLTPLVARLHQPTCQTLYFVLGFPQKCVIRAFFLLWNSRMPFFVFVSGARTGRGQGFVRIRSHISHGRGGGSSTMATEELPNHCMFAPDVCCVLLFANLFDCCVIRLSLNGLSKLELGSKSSKN